MFIQKLNLYLFASVLLHLVTMDLSRFVQVEYSLINNEHKLDTLIPLNKYISLIADQVECTQ